MCHRAKVNVNRIRTQCCIEEDERHSQEYYKCFEFKRMLVKSDVTSTYTGSLSLEYSQQQNGGAG